MAGAGPRVMPEVPLVGPGSGVDAQSVLNIIYIMRNAVSVCCSLRRLRLAMAAALARLLLATAFPTSFRRHMPPRAAARAALRATPYPTEASRSQFGYLARRLRWPSRTETTMALSWQNPFDNKDAIGGGRSMKELKIRPVAFGAAVAFSFFVGAATVWITADLSWQLPGDNSGSKADWAAAYGTWVLGIAASAVAVGTYVHSRKQERASRVAVLDATRLLIADAVSLDVTVNGLLKEGKRWVDLSQSLKLLEASSAAIKIDSMALSHMPYAAGRKLVSINNRLAAFRAMLTDARIIRLEGKSPREPLDDLQREALQLILDFLKPLDEDCKAFVRIIVAASKE